MYLDLTYEIRYYIYIYFLFMYILSEKDEKNNGLDKGVIAAAVVSSALVVLIAVCVIFWQWKRHKKRIFMEKEMNLAVDFGKMNTHQPA